MKNPVVTIEMENGDIMKAELYPEIAPNTVNNFISLIKKGFYDGLIFHRVIKDFMIQGGCPLGNGTGGPGWNIKGEFAANGVNNPIKHVRGVISMARSMNPNSAGSQFFIMGHPEYDPDTLAREYRRDIDKGLDIAVPAHYFPEDDPARVPVVRWRSAGQLLYTNWLNYYLYQTTPYDLSKVR